jgi:hypothetical protein
MQGMTAKRWIIAVLIGLAVLLLLLWLARAEIAVRVAQSYFRGHGIESTVEIGALGLSGGSGRFALGPRDNPTISAERIELYFDPLRWIPRVVEVRLVNPVVRARLDESGKVRLEALQEWIDSLQQQEGKSRFVSDDLAVSLTGLRLLFTTSSGALDVGGDVKLVRNVPVSASLRVRPATIAWQGASIQLRAASLDFNSGGHLAVRLAASAKKGDLALQDANVSLDATGFKWVSDQRLFISAPQVAVNFSAASLTAGQVFTAPKLNLMARNLAARLGQEMTVRADLTGAASVDTKLAVSKTFLAQDRALAQAMAANLAHLDLDFRGRLEQRGNQTSFLLTAPLQMRGARDGLLQLSTLRLAGTPEGVTASLQASLAGKGLPAFKLASDKLTWRDGVLTGNAALSARFNYAMMRGANLTTQGALSWQSGRYTFQPSQCARATLVAFHPGASDLARDVRTSICASAGQPLLVGEGAAWTFTGAARSASAFLPLGNAQVEQAAAHLAFQGVGGDFHGTATVTTGRVSDRLKPIRFKPMLGRGSVALKAGVWRGRFAMMDVEKTPLGDVTFNHVLASSSGTAHIAAPKLTFVPDKLQPEDISPLLAAFRRAEGAASFTGDIDWTKSEITSRGELSIDSLNFLTPLGKATAVKTKLAFTSLLPPTTADNQTVIISRIDWTLPFTGVDLRFAFSPTLVKVNALSSGWAEGRAALGPLTINMANLKQVSGTATLTSIALGSLVTASNLGERVKLEGKISGTIPFQVTPEGVRITKGRIASDGPGRLSINRSLWNQGGTVSVNAVQDFAYQALEYLAYDEMTAELNSIANGRLSILFKIKGKSDPPKPQVAEIAITDIINGTALQKSVPLPSGTPIDLTLDTSLNFDELLKFYTEAWSKTLSPEGQPDASGVERKR